jgi:hypothetical protein
LKLLERSAEVFLLLILAILGVFVLYRPIIMSDFTRVPGDLGDARFVNLCLEHNYRYFFTDSNLRFWSPDWLFFPVSNGLAMSDVMTGTSWIYSIFRLANIDSLHSMQLWLLSCSILSFLTMYLLLRQFRLGIIGSSVPAYIFAFGMPRIAYVNHPQLAQAFFAPLILWCVLKFNVSTSRTSQIAMLMLAGSLLALQFWSAFYLGWFFVLLVLIALVSWCFKRERIATLTDFLLVRRIPVAVGVSVFTVLTAPLAVHYLRMSSAMGQRGWGEVLMYMPEIRALITPHQDSLLYHDFVTAIRGNMSNYSEKTIFAGFLYVMAPFGLYWGITKRPRSFASLSTLDVHQVRWVAVVAMVCTVLTLRIGHGGSLWLLPYYLVPGASAIRAAGRFIHLTLIPVGLCLAILLTQLATWRRPWGLAAVLFLSAFAIAENWANYDYSFPVQEHEERVGRIKQQLAANQDHCDLFFARGSGPSYAVQLDAMWVSIETGVPTLNGYSGFNPPGFVEGGLDQPLKVTQAKLNEWQAQHGISGKRACLL